MNDVRYTINADGTLEKWFLEKELPERGETALRKTPTLKWNCSMKIFPSDRVRSTYKEAKAELAYFKKWITGFDMSKADRITLLEMFYAMDKEDRMESDE